MPGIFISRLIPGGLAESTGLLAVKDEVIEVNGIEVSGKTLDQVTDMMVANSSNLIITVKPFNQKTCIRRSKFMAPAQTTSTGETPSQSINPRSSVSLSAGGSITPESHRLSHPPRNSPSQHHSRSEVPEVPGTIDI